MSPQWPVPLPGRPRIHSRTFAHRGPVTDRLLDCKDQPPAPTEQDSANGHRGARTAKKSDRFSEEFADLVRQRPPSLGNEPGRWLSRLPAELFRYYDRGVASFGHRPQSDRERRGRVYLLHTALVLLWMEWGRKGARRRLREQTQKAVRRTARLTCLEHYRRGGVLTDYESRRWFGAESGRWAVSVRSSAVDTERVSSPALRAALETAPVAETSVEGLSALCRERAVPKRADLPLSE